MTYLILAFCVVAIIGVPFAAWYEAAKKEMDDEGDDE